MRGAERDPRGRDPQGRAARRWADALAAWAIPDDILRRAPRSPWVQAVDEFTVAEQIPDSPSHRRARQALDAAAAAGGAPSVLDIGCGGGRAAFAVAPPAVRVTGVDARAEMLQAFSHAARSRSLSHAQVLGVWPEVADRAPTADAVLAHHVAYNVGDLGAFALAATDHARRRVVLELSDRHPLTPMAPLWRHFWGVQRPDGPTAQDALAVLLEAGLPARIETWTEDDGTCGRAVLDHRRRVELTRIRLCLPAERDPEIAEVLTRSGPPGPRRVATLWWDVGPAPGDQPAPA